jgi:DNA-binding transcriptional ArsR family regulator
MAMNRSTKAPTIDAVLSALADPRRRKVVDILRREPKSAGDLSRLTGLPASAISKHLRQLKECGLVRESHPDYDARVRIYALNVSPLADLKVWLEDTEEMWANQLAAFKKHIERGS